MRHPTLSTFALTLLLAAAPALAMAAQSSQDPSAPAQNSAQLNAEAQHNKANADYAKGRAKRSKKAEKADRKAAKKEAKVAKDQQKAADANAEASH